MKRWFGRRFMIGFALLRMVAGLMFAVRRSAEAFWISPIRRNGAATAHVTDRKILTEARWMFLARSSATAQ